MRKGVIYFYLFSMTLGTVIGCLSGGLIAYNHPMKDMEGNWSSSYFLETDVSKYFISTLTSFAGRDIYVSSDIYNDRSEYEGSINRLFRVVDIKNTIFNSILTAMTPFYNGDRKLHNYLQNPYDVSYPLFFILDCNTMITEQLLGGPVGSIRLLERRDKINCHSNDDVYK